MEKITRFILGFPSSPNLKTREGLVSENKSIEPHNLF